MPAAEMTVALLEAHRGFQHAQLQLKAAKVGLAPKFDQTLTALLAHL